MTDEEKKAIEWVKNNLEETIKLSQKYGLQKAIKYQTTILNLIEKQSKEIEHQKEKRENQKRELAILNAKQIEFNKLVNTVNSYKGQFKRQQKEIEELKQEKEYLNCIIESDKDNYINKDKIKAKIEELKERPNKMVIDKEIPEEYKNIFLDENAILVLQSLLEEKEG